MTDSLRQRTPDGAGSIRATLGGELVGDNLADEISIAERFIRRHRHILAAGGNLVGDVEEIIRKMDGDCKSYDEFLEELAKLRQACRRRIREARGEGEA